MGARYKHNYKAFGAEVLRPGGLMEPVIMAAAHRVKAAAEALAPVGDPADDPHPGLYKESFYVRSEDRTNRIHGIVGNSADYAEEVEFGSPMQRAHHVLLRALDAAGE